MDKQEEFDRQVAKLISGLSVPVSIGVPLGKAAEPWHKLYAMLDTFGYPNDEAVYQAMLRYRREQGNKVVATAD